MGLLINKAIALLIGLVTLLYCHRQVLAANGTIDSSHRYAWTENAGWLDFGCTNCNVVVSDSTVTGYAYGENIGWINLAPATSGVVNSSGTLSGYAYGENVGWINFSPSGGGVTIDSSGVFSGYAYGENVGWIVFNCSTTSSCNTVNYYVSTDWRPASARGGGSSIVAFSSSALTVPSAPAGGWQAQASVMNNAGSLSINAGVNIRYVAVSKTTDFSKTSLIPYQPGQALNLPSQELGYVKLYNAWGYSTEPIAINTKTEKPATPTTPDPSALADGVLVKEKGQSAVYYVQNGQKLPIVSGQVFEKLGFKWNAIVELNNLDHYPTGSIVTNETPLFKNTPVASVPVQSAKQVLGAKTSNLPTAKFTYGLSLGMSDVAVKELQQLLASQPELYPEGQVSGYFGSLTQAAVQRFQKKYNLVKGEQDSGYGYVGPKTRDKLNEVFNLR